MDTRINDVINNKRMDYIAPFLWLHGESHEELLEELEAVHRSGINSVCFESRVHEQFCEKEWWDDLRFLLDECKKRNMRAWILDERHCPSGSANNAFEKDPTLMPYEITERHVDIPGPVTDECLLCNCWKEEPGDEVIAVVAYKHKENDTLLKDVSVNLTDGIDNDMVYFSLGEGLWRVFFLIKTRKNVLPFCDKLRSESTDIVISEVYDKHYENLKEYFGNTLLGFFCDEPGFHNNYTQIYASPMGLDMAQYPWGECVISRFKELYGDKAYEKLALLWFATEGGSSKEARYEYMETITKAYQKNYSNKLAKWCRDHGVMFIGHILEDNNRHAETGAGPGHFFRAIGDQDMSGIDVVIHQITPGLNNCISVTDASYRNVNNKFAQYYLAKMGVSFGHADSRKKGRTMCEIFGAYGYAEGTKTMKYLADHMLVRGINYFVPHAFSPKKNDQDSPPHFYKNGENPQFKYFKNIMDYMQKTCHLIDGGIHVSSCAIVYNAFAMYSGGKYLPLENIAKELYDNNIDYDILPEYILETAEHGIINGERYNVIILPYSEYIPQNIIDSLKKSGIKVVVVTPNDEKSVFETISLKKLVSYFRENSYDDVVCSYEEGLLRSYHYSRNGAEIYLFSNEDINKAVNAKIELKRFVGGNYCVYDAMDNKAYKCYSNDGKMELEVLPYNMKIVITGDIDWDSIPEFVAKKMVKKNAIDSFKISISETGDNYEVVQNCGKLFNITGKDKYQKFSGFMKYSFSFKDETADSKVIEFGEVGEIAELTVNGKLVGSKIAPPYNFDITEFVKNGNNHVELVVANSLAFRVRDYYSRYMLMGKSGLLGPVSICYYKEV